MKKRTAVILLVTGILCVVGAVVAIAAGIMGFVDDLKPLVTVEAPGSAEFQIDAPGPYTLWHDFSTSHGGSFHHYDRRLPNGFTFTLIHAQSGRSVPFQSSRTTSTMTVGQHESAGLGTFQVPDPGTYKLEASNPDRDQRFISLTQGTFMSSFGSFGASFGIAALSGVLGMALLIAGFIGVLTGRKKPPTPPVPAA